MKKKKPKKPVRQIKSVKQAKPARQIEKKPLKFRRWKRFPELTKLEKVRLIAILAAVLFVAGGIVYLLIGFKVRNFTVEGSTHYTAQEIRGMVITDRFCENSIFLKLKLKLQKIEDIPFVEHMDVKILDRNSVHIVVYEKAIAGYVVYLENRMYFDKDGIVVESSKEEVPGVPEITGLIFDHVVLHEPLPVEDPRIFKDILNMTQLLNKYSLKADRIYFDEQGKVTLFFDDVRIPLGSDQYMEEKVSHLANMLAETDLRLFKGKLNMEKFDPENPKTGFIME